MKQFTENKDCKCIKTKNNFVLDLRKDSFSNLQVFYEYYWKVMNLYEEQRNDWSVQKVSFVFRIFTFCYV